MDKIDTSTAEEAVKDAARQFMSDLLPTAAPTVDEVSLKHPSDGTTSSAIPTTTTSGTDIIKTWKAAYGAATATSSSGRLFHHEDAAQRLMTQFWSLYDPAVSSIWTMQYDHAASTESFSEARNIVTTLLTQNKMVTTMEHECFGIVHILEGNEIHGLWFFNGPDPEPLFGANDETSWYTWKQLGPDLNTYIKDIVTSKITPPAEYPIQDTQIF
jgi:hypothetical protein